MTLPPVRPTPCHECPWRRTSVAGFTGPHTAVEWAALAHSDAPIACHTSIPPGNDEAWVDGMLQCAGAASFRASVLKRPRDPEVAVGPEHKNMFRDTIEFLEHHGSSKAEYMKETYS